MFSKILQYALLTQITQISLPDKVRLNSIAISDNLLC